MKNPALGFAILAVLVFGLFTFASRQPRQAAVAPAAAPEASVTDSLSTVGSGVAAAVSDVKDRKSTRLNSSH